MVPQPFPTCLVAACCCSSWCLLCLSPAMTSARTCCPRRPPTLLLHHPPPSPRPSPLLPVRGDTCGATITSKETCARGSSTLTTSTFSRSRRTARSAAPRRRTAPSVSTVLPPRCRAAAAAPPERRRSPGPAAPEPSHWGGKGKVTPRRGGGAGQRWGGLLRDAAARQPVSANLSGYICFANGFAEHSLFLCLAEEQIRKICKDVARSVCVWGALSPESASHYPLSLKFLDENAVLKQCIDFPRARAHTHSSPRAAQELSAPRSLLPEPGTGGVSFGLGFCLGLFSAVGVPGGAGSRCAAAQPPAVRLYRCLPRRWRARCAPPLPGCSAAIPLLAAL